MIAYGDSRVLPYPIEEVFGVVADVDKYAQFLPWCVASRIRMRKGTELEADVIIGYGPFREKFVSKVHLTPPSHIEVEYLQGPFDRLVNHWSFESISPGETRVDFHVSFSFQSKLLDTLVRNVFDKACQKIIQAFEDRLAQEEIRA